MIVRFLVHYFIEANCYCTRSTIVHIPMACQVVLCLYSAVNTLISGLVQYGTVEPPPVRQSRESLQACQRDHGLHLFILRGGVFQQPVSSAQMKFMQGQARMQDCSIPRESQRMLFRSLELTSHTLEPITCVHFPRNPHFAPFRSIIPWV